MTWISKSITALGLMLLAHACYSAQEFAALQAYKATSAVTAAGTLGTAAPSASPTSTSPSLPVDISVEAVAALLVTCLGLVLGTPYLRPIEWRVWAGTIEREGPEGFTNAEGEVDKDYVGNPFRALETRPGFVDIRRQREEFAEWVKNAGPGAGDGDGEKS